MVHKSFFMRWVRVLFPLLLIGLITLQCGIPSYPYLYPPIYVKESTGADTTFQFKNDTRTNLLYLEGYEIYYKFYSDNVADTSYSSDKTQIDGMDDGMEGQTVTFLQNLKFNRMYETLVSPGSYTKPLLSIEPEDKNTEFSVTIDFSYLDETTKPYPVVTFSSSSVEIARYVTVDNSIDYYLESFLPENFQYTYSDVDSSLASESFLNIAVVVFTYGVDEDLSELYSLPLHLGRIRLSTLL